MLQRRVDDLSKRLLICVRGLPSEWCRLLRSRLWLVVLLKLQTVLLRPLGVEACHALY